MLTDTQTDTHTDRHTHTDTHTDAHEHHNKPRPAELAGFNNTFSEHAVKSKLSYSNSFIQIIIVYEALQHYFYVGLSNSYV